MCERSEAVAKLSIKKQILYLRSAKPDGTPTCIPQKHIWNKSKQLSDCSSVNTRRHARGNHANIHLLRVSGTETGAGKQWLYVFVAGPQKLIAAYLHSRDHTQRSLLNGETHIVIKDIVIKSSGSVWAIL